MLLFESITGLCILSSCISGSSLFTRKTIPELGLGRQNCILPRFHLLYYSIKERQKCIFPSSAWDCVSSGSTRSCNNYSDIINLLIGVYYRILSFTAVLPPRNLTEEVRTEMAKPVCTSSLSLTLVEVFNIINWNKNCLFISQYVCLKIGRRYHHENVDCFLLLLLISIWLQ